MISNTIRSFVQQDACRSSKLDLVCLVSNSCTLQYVIILVGWLKYCGCCCVSLSTPTHNKTGPRTKKMQYIVTSVSMVKARSGVTHVEVCLGGIGCN